jgi:hypothetical protein
MKSFFQKKNAGLTIVEVVIASAIILAATLALIGVHGFYLKSALSNTDTVKAVHLAEEGIEGMRYLRDDSWQRNIESLSPDTPYGLELIGGVWQAVPNVWIDGMSRSVTISSVFRDSSSDIVSGGGTLDPNTVLVTSSVSWSSSGATTTKTIATYLTNLWDN